MNTAKTAISPEKKFITHFLSPIGPLKIVTDNYHLLSVWFEEKAGSERDSSPIIDETISQLQDYFSHKREEFSVPMLFEGTPFQQRVWNHLSKIPFGKTTSYSQVAAALGDLKSIRAVGTANGRNPIPIIVPCHRVIGANGSLTGYGGGLWRKKWLLDFEQKNKQQEIIW